MLIYVTDALSNTSIAINPEQVISVLVVPEGEHPGKTAAILTQGNVIVNDDFLELVGRINGELQ